MQGGTRKRSKLALLASAGGLILGTVGAVTVAATPAQAVTGNVDLEFYNSAHILISTDVEIFADSNETTCRVIAPPAGAVDVRILNVTTSPASLYADTDCTGTAQLTDPALGLSPLVAVPTDLSLLAG